MNTFYIVIAVVAVWFIAVYNGLVRLRNRAKEAWSDIDVQLKRRYDLIPNLVEAVKGYMAHERQVFEKVTEARARAMGVAEEGPPSRSSVADSVRRSPLLRAKAENMLSGALKSLFAVAENYPQLRASENFKQLQDELSDTENKIQAARRFYNTNVRDLNIKIETFPSNLVAGAFGFAKMEFFGDLNEAEREPVKVRF